MNLLFVPLALLLYAQQGHPADSVVMMAEAIVAQMPGKTEASPLGFRAPLVGRLVDRVPFQGEHWMHFDRVALQYASSIVSPGRNKTVDLSKPTFVMFSRIGEGIVPVGIAYTQLLAPNEETPTRLGKVYAPWHEHQKCINVPDEVHALAHGPDDCRARGGTPTLRRVGMAHVWIVPNPTGRFANYNPALPFLALGLTPPDSLTLADPATGLRIRKLALALAEMYDARLPYARRSEHFNRSVALAESLAVHRTAVAELLPALRAADAQGNQRDYDEATDRVIRHGEALRTTYLSMATTPALRAQIEADYRRVLELDTSHH